MKSTLDRKAGDFASARNVDHDKVVAADGYALAFFQKRQAVRTAREHADGPAARAIPEVNPVGARAGDDSSIWRKGQRPYPSRMTKAHGAQARQRSLRQRVAVAVRAARFFVFGGRRGGGGNLLLWRLIKLGDGSFGDHQVLDSQTPAGGGQAGEQRANQHAFQLAHGQAFQGSFESMPG